MIRKIYSYNIKISKWFNQEAVLRKSRRFMGSVQLKNDMPGCFLECTIMVRGMRFLVLVPLGTMTCVFAC